MSEREPRFHTSSQLAEYAGQGMPDCPKSERAVQIWADRDDWRHRKDQLGRPMARRRKGRGGGWEYSERLLSRAAQAWLARKHGPDALVEDAAASPKPAGLAEIHLAAAAERLRAIEQVEEYQRAGLSKRAAVAEVCAETGRTASVVHGWFKMVAGLPLAERLPALAPRHALGKDFTNEPLTDGEDAGGLKDWQRETMQGRAAVLAEIDERVIDGSGRDAAIREIVKLAKEGGLPAELQELSRRANAKAGKGRALSRSQIYEWFKAREAGGIVALAPAAPPQAGIPAWAGPLIALYAQPQKPSLLSVMEDLPERLPEGVAMPTYDQARRFIKRLSAVERNRRRMGPRALKALKAHVVRDVSELWPTAVYVADGHCFDAEVAHPMHGRPFRPEITGVIDIYTRRIAGWSVGLAESTLTVLDAARHAFETSGLCDIWYVDRGTGFNNAAFDAELTGFLARLEITKKRSLPYNSQARGIIERLHQSIWVRAAKKLPTYMGAAMDDEARQKAFKITRKEIATGGRSRLLMEWRDFLSFCEAEAAAYNARPHSGLPKIRDSETGRKRHMSPDEAWAAAEAGGWSADPVGPEESVDLFRPYEVRRCRRAMVQIFGNSYFHTALEAFHDEDVQVGYDIHDASRAWVRSLDGRLICVAEFEGNKRSFFPVTMAEAAHERRIEGRKKRLEVKLGEVEAERRAPLIVDGDTGPTPEQLARAEVELDRMIDPPAPAELEGRPRFGTDEAWAAWLAENPGEVTERDRELLRERLRSRPFRTILEDFEGVDLGTLDRLAKQTTEAA